MTFGKGRLSASPLLPFNIIFTADPSQKESERVNNEHRRGRQRFVKWETQTTGLSSLSAIRIVFSL